MAKFRKKPVVVDAYLVGSVPYRELADWCGGIIIRDGHKYVGIQIDTLEGKMLANSCDWIIKGVAGEFYPCKPDIFEQTYEPVEAPDGDAEQAAREDERHKINDTYQKDWREGREPLEQKVAELEAALSDIAKGMIPPKSAPNTILEGDGSPAEFRSAMWTWSQQRAREALAAAKGGEKDE